MAQCEDCNTEIDDKYTRCIACNNKRKVAKESKASESQAELIKALGAINNNLYCVRRQMAVLLRERYHQEIIWDKKKKDFIEKEID